MTSHTYLDRLLAQVGDLPPLSVGAQKSLQLLRDPEVNTTELARVLALDEALASLVLRWSNSIYYGLKYPASTVHQAVVYLGHQTVQSLIMAASLAPLLDRPSPGYGLERGDLWRHSIGVAAGARLVAAKKYGRHMAEEAYHAGLLCDIGKLALDILLRDVDTSSENWKNVPFSELERKYFGIDHAALGAEMARRWNFPDSLAEAIAFHHQPSRAGRGVLLASAVHIADAAVMMLGIGIGKDGLQYELDPLACARMDWDEAKFNELVERVIPFIEEADEFFQLGSL